jgi:hypothetical protein
MDKHTKYIKGVLIIIRTRVQRLKENKRVFNTSKNRSIIID